MNIKAPKNASDEASFDRDVKAQEEAMYEFLGDVLSSIGPRGSCSPDERRLGERVARDWKKLGFDVRREPFTLVRHDPGLVELATRVAQDRGRKMQVSVVPIGASDATVFSRAGI